jgi:hypothetical protein
MPSVLGRMYNKFIKRQGPTLRSMENPDLLEPPKSAPSAFNAPAMGNKNYKGEYPPPAEPGNAGFQGPLRPKNLEIMQRKKNNAKESRLQRMRLAAGYNPFDTSNDPPHFSNDPQEGSNKSPRFEFPPEPTRRKTRRRRNSRTRRTNRK